MSNVTSPQTSLLQNAAVVLSAACGGTAYLLTLADYYAWWTVFPVALLAYPAAMIVAAFLCLCCEERLSRWIVLLLGGGFAWTGLLEPGRFPTFLMGVAFLVVGLAASNYSGADTAAEADRAAKSGGD
ncbi:hypothetical protein Mal4_20320 [Maioricimonas rarisocia]|uniref:Uncharacterized protein n=1 Tax=Maioricimonas rarisocia TaxID=2528026 RepID=A0A517Z5G0_9PLAN|nr:hypothetical protein [Maioricimonas rarisocia]QDU37716.1 hypothetical protein Mal4_20320 [Maioricimonas rarisocia]